MGSKTLVYPQNLLTFDLEDWFHILDIPNKIDWNSALSRIDRGLDLFLQLLSKYNVSCTFFILGWVAEKRSNLVKRIYELGHEVASHGYGHQLIYELGREEFRQDMRRAKSILEDLTGGQVFGYRGPGFSITRKNLWAFDIIAEEGFQYDATLYPGTHGHGGIRGLPSQPFTIETLNEQSIEEYPATLVKFAGFSTAFAGGGYFRLFPHFLTSLFINCFNKKGLPVMSYFHPRDLDKDVPRLPMSLKRKFKCYVNLSSTYGKLEKILAMHSFGSIREWRSVNNISLPSFPLRKLG